MLFGSLITKIINWLIRVLEITWQINVFGEQNK